MWLTKESNNELEWMTQKNNVSMLDQAGLKLINFFAVVRKDVKLSRYCKV